MGSTLLVKAATKVEIVPSIKLGPYLAHTSFAKSRLRVDKPFIITIILLTIAATVTNKVAPPVRTARKSEDKAIVNRISPKNKYAKPTTVTKPPFSPPLIIYAPLPLFGSNIRLLALVKI